ncbi:MAG: ABC transporter substrate-binding protein [Deltaproteobacteria bacterium]|nr:ABC transporter substrate-binding protein [Deltaproteobacteria bacterium]
MTRDRVIAIVILGLAIVLGRVPLSAVQASLESEGRSRDAQVAREGDAITIEDPVLDEQVTLRASPTRIVSLTLASDVMLASLVSIDRVLGVTALVDDPSYSRAAGHYPASIPRVSASAEALLALTPDLVVLTGYSHPATARALVDAGVPVLRLPSGRTLDEVRASLVMLARAVGGEARASEALARFDRDRTRLERTRSETRPRALFLAAGGFTHGRGTLTHELLELAGLDNVAEERGLSGLSRIGAETVAASRPDVIVVAADDDEEAARAITQLAPGLEALLSHTRRIAIPSLEIESTSPDCLDAAVHLREAIASTEGTR